ncbi:hypothetical protein [Terrarubrum flagellatum]|uniref:hypothetical protein n=1 Tax=Terrirubrum flagellatum TaxID=2895980 RepID=UPI00314513B3
MGRKSGDPVKDEKAERLAAALRENLKRRKTQARGRATEEPPRDPPAASRDKPAKP